jgi:hypothetical protein
MSGRIWLAVACVAAVLLLVWGGVRTGASTIAWCRLSGGTPTTEPTTLALSKELSPKPVAVVVTVCGR